MKWTLVNPAGTNDPDTGDIYSGLDRFGRVKDNRWLDGAGDDLDRIQYGYDRASNRIWRRNVVAAALGKEFDELYGYDAIHRLKHMARGTLNGSRTALTSETFAQCWTLDSTGNWQGFREDDTGNGTWDLIQQRSANAVNEISGISETAGPSWVTPAYSRAGNMTTMPQPADPTASYTATYDAWNRLVKIADGADTVSEYAYDGAKRRIVQKSYSGGVLDETRHLYYTEPSSWQVLEERVGTSPDSADAERQFVWGLRYVDNLVLRDQDTDANGSLDERLYAVQDDNWNGTAFTDEDGNTLERHAFSAYGTPFYLDFEFVPRSPEYGWETLYSGYRNDTLNGFYYVRNRVSHPTLGLWLQRDPIRYTGGSMSLIQYCVGMPLNSVDPSGLGSVPHTCDESIGCGGGGGGPGFAWPRLNLWGPGRNIPRHFPSGSPFQPPTPSPGGPAITPPISLNPPINVPYQPPFPQPSPIAQPFPPAIQPPLSGYPGIVSGPKPGTGPGTNIPNPGLVPLPGYKPKPGFTIPPDKPNCFEDWLCWCCVPQNYPDETFRIASCADTPVKDCVSPAVCCPPEVQPVGTVLAPGQTTNMGSCYGSGPDLLDKARRGKS